VVRRHWCGLSRLGFDWNYNGDGSLNRSSGVFGSNLGRLGLVLQIGKSEAQLDLGFTEGFEFATVLLLWLVAIYFIVRFVRWAVPFFYNVKRPRKTLGF
jgi:hypothetical protein